MGKSLSTLISTTFQNLSASRRSHSLTETVYFASLSFFGLVRSFHTISPTFALSQFYFFLFLHARVGALTSILYIKFPFSVKQFCQLFWIFVRLLRRIASSYRQNKVLEAFIYQIFYRERGHCRIKRQHNFFFVQRF